MPPVKPDNDKRTLLWYNEKTIGGNFYARRMQTYQGVRKRNTGVKKTGVEYVLLPVILDGMTA